MLLREREGEPEAGVEAGAEGWLRGWVERLAVPRHAVVEARENRRVGALVGSALEAAGLRVVEQGKHRNVVALPERWSGVLVGAHFDSVPGCPGADDNASGVAAMLAAAAALGGGGGVGFVAFNAEEDGLLGSRDFVARGLDELGLDVKLVHVLEMVGYRARGQGSQRSPLPPLIPAPKVGDFIGLIGRGPSNAAVSAALASRVPGAPRRVGLSTWGALQRFFPDLGRSDHLPFWEGPACRRCSGPTRPSFATRTTTGSLTAQTPSITVS